jgi:hypothetical protein
MSACLEEAGAAFHHDPFAHGIYTLVSQCLSHIHMVHRSLLPISWSSGRAKKRSISGGFCSSAERGRAATVARMHLDWNASSVGDKATSVPVMSLLDCSHRMCFFTRPREKATRVAIPRGEKIREVM